MNITSGYVSPCYFCDRLEETSLLTSAICKEKKASNVTSRPFLQRHILTASTVQGAIKGLLEKDSITLDLGTYTLCDQFFAQWLLKQ